MSESVIYWRLYPRESEQATHLDGMADSYTLCGMDTAGDDTIYRKPPEQLEGTNHRVTCAHCLQIIGIVRDYLRSKGERWT